MREEDGRSSRSPRQQSISRSRARLRSRANETKRGASRSRGKAKENCGGAQRSSAKGGVAEAAENTGPPGSGTAGKQGVAEVPESREAKP